MNDCCFELGLFKGSTEHKSTPLLCAVSLRLTGWFAFPHQPALHYCRLCEKRHWQRSQYFRVTWADRKGAVTSLRWSGVDICTHQYLSRNFETLRAWSGTPVGHWGFLGEGLNCFWRVSWSHLFVDFFTRFYEDQKWIWVILTSGTRKLNSFRLALVLSTFRSFETCLYAGW